MTSLKLYSWISSTSISTILALLMSDVGLNTVEQLTLQKYLVSSFNVTVLLVNVALVTLRESILLKLFNDEDLFCISQDNCSVEFKKFPVVFTLNEKLTVVEPNTLYPLVGSLGANKPNEYVPDGSVTL